MQPPAKTTIQFEDIKILFRANPMKAATYHFAGRLAFLADKTIVFGVGDGYSYMDDAQDLSSHLGKIIRLNDDGSVPKDNPYVGVKNALPEIYSYGHRNPQGLFYDVEQNVLFSNEHGPKGGDEVNIIKPKLNYGWPEITYGIDYTGFEITPHQTKPGMETPLVNWTPSIAPSSIIVYRGQAFPKLNGLLLNTALKYREIRVVKLGKAQANQAQSKNGKTLIENKSNLSHSNYTLITQKTLLKDKNERLRDIAIDNSGLIYLITDSGKLLQINPK
jgi:aldose sugar dehydrogenase